MKKYPQDTKFGAWSVYPETQRKKRVYVIRRSVHSPGEKPKSERLPRKQYRQWVSDPVELRRLCVRLNDQVSREEKLKETVEIKHAYISPIFLDDYKKHLLTQVPTARRAKAEYQFLVKYFLNFFINKLQLPDPLQWQAHHKTKWAEYLLSNEVPSAASTKKEIVRAANRFMIYLHDHRPREVPPLKFTPISKPMFKKIEADRDLAGKMRERKFIDDEAWQKISEKLPRLAPSIEPFVSLAYNYGLRRSETMGFGPNDVRRGYLHVRQQLLSFTDGKAKFGPLKGRKPRKVPHDWFASPEIAKKAIERAATKLMHPDTLTDQWTKFMKEIGFDFDFHDLRHTWITRAMRLNGNHEGGVREVQLAAGHENIETTMRYLKDDRTLDDEVYRDAS